MGVKEVFYRAVNLWLWEMQMGLSAEQKHSDIAALQAQLWQALHEQEYQQISLASLSEGAGISEVQAILSAGSIERLLASALQEIDDRALAQSAEDFAQDAQASVHEKLLEGLVHRFEVYSDKRAALQKLASGAYRHPSLAIVLACNLRDFVDRLLSICGDGSSGIVRGARIKGVCAVALKASLVWQREDSPDLSKTLKTLDKDLKTATEWAISLRILPRDSADQAE